MASSTSMSAGGVSVPRQYAEKSEVTGWVGWIAFAGTMMALLGVVVVSISALVNFAWANLYPFWSLTLLAMNFLVIYAIIAHGSEMKAAKEI